jgi:acyl-CoA thioesterase-1
MLSLIPVELMQRLLFACLLLTSAAVTPVWSRGVNELACDMPPELTTPSAPLTRVTAALRADGDLNILALGSGSTVGENGASNGPAMAVSTPERSFPYRLVEMLRAMRPGTRFNLTVRGGRSMTADAMLPILRRELAAHHYEMVLWQTGTVEAVHGVRPDVLRGVLEDGAEAADKADADLVLIDPQYSRFLRANADLSPYETVLAQMASDPGVTLFRRFDLTQAWVNNGQVDLERVSRDERDKTIALLNDCLGQALARYVLATPGEH